VGPRTYLDVLEKSLLPQPGFEHQISYIYITHEHTHGYIYIYIYIYIRVCVRVFAEHRGNVHNLDVFLNCMLLYVETTVRSCDLLPYPSSITSREFWERYGERLTRSVCRGRAFRRFSAISYQFLGLLHKILNDRHLIVGAI
jgi:hypothetical protein